MVLCNFFALNQLILLDFVYRYSYEFCFTDKENKHNEMKRGIQIYIEYIIEPKIMFFQTLMRGSQWYQQTWLCKGAWHFINLHYKRIILLIYSFIQIFISLILFNSFAKTLLYTKCYFTTYKKELYFMLTTALGHRSYPQQQRNSNKIGNVFRVTQLEGQMVQFKPSSFDYKFSGMCSINVEVKIKYK